MKIEINYEISLCDSHILYRNLQMGQPIYGYL